MTTARQDLVAHLTTALPTMKIIGELAALTNAKSAVVLVSRGSIVRADQQGARDDHLVVWLLSPFLDPAAAEADLDANLDVVLAAIESHPYLHWLDGERDVYNQAFHAFRMTVPHRTILEEA